MLGNIFEINPIGIFNSLAGKGDISNTCYLRNEDIGSNKKFQKKQRCSPKSQPVQCLPAIFENFENKGKKNNYYKIIIGIIVIIFSIILIKLKK